VFGVSQFKTHAICDKQMQYVNSWSVAWFYTTWLLRMRETKMSRTISWWSKHRSIQKTHDISSLPGRHKGIVEFAKIIHYNIRVDLVEQLWAKKSFNIGWKVLYIVPFIVICNLFNPRILSSNWEFLGILLELY
jgi:hypothetical protein